MSSTAVQVAVRCRPLSAKELRENSRSIITMEGTATSAADPTGKLKPITFTYDYSFWSTNPEDAHLPASRRSTKRSGSAYSTTPFWATMLASLPTDRQALGRPTA